MKKILLSCLIFIGFNSHVNSQITVFEDGFETYADFAIANVGSWTLTDVDLKTTYGFEGSTFANSGAAKSFQVFNAAATTPPLTPSATSNWTARTGSRSMVCFAATSTPWNNDWLISPQITLGTAGNVLTFWAKSCDATYGLEKFKVGISSTASTTGVTLLSVGTITTASNVTWTQYSYNVPASFNGLPVYFSINCISDDQFGLAIDDFKVTATALGTSDFFKSNFTVFPNPSSDIVSISNNNNISINSIEVSDMNGRIIKNVDANTTSFSVRELNAGVYFLKVSTTDGVGTTKFVKQ